ncbi:MAG TPA: FKBP-type peptidyl-prolyl cis-trans isomerase [Pyrinomonadaceae bacterium]|nr:FKBP-type peptidyl-prolyl cis-trans isomerase [Pyrinomonadaceae bacterium]
MKSLTIFFIIAVSLGITGPLAQGQTRHRRVRRHRVRKTKPVTPINANAITMTKTPSGLVYVITRRSTGQAPQPGQTVIVNYTGLLGSGMKFDSSLDRGQPLKFKLGEGRVIKGWDEGIAKLRVGEQATLIIPPQLGYGTRGAGGVIPPDATLIFIVELMGVEAAQILK